MNSDPSIYDAAEKDQRQLISEVLYKSNMDALISILYHMEGRYMTAKQCFDILIAFHDYQKEIHRFPWQIPGDNFEMFKLILEKGNGLFFKMSDKEEMVVMNELDRLRKLD
jgi:hypothetical protein